jgi:hypothetical protein
MRGAPVTAILFVPYRLAAALRERAITPPPKDIGCARQRSGTVRAPNSFCR